MLFYRFRPKNRIHGYPVGGFGNKFWEINFGKINDGGSL